MTKKHTESYCLVTTALTELWDLENRLIFLGPWCLTGSNAEKIIEKKDYIIASSPWSLIDKRKDAAVYRYALYKEVITLLSERLNIIHDVTYPEKYWSILVGPWLMRFISILYDRYKRIENVVKLYPEFYTYVLPKNKCMTTSYSFDDFLSSRNGKARGDYYNLILYSLLVYELCPDKAIEKDINYKLEINTTKWSLKRKLLHVIQKPMGFSFNASIIFSEMYHHLPINDLVKLKMSLGFKNVHVMNPSELEPQNGTTLKKNYSHRLRDALKMNLATDEFRVFLSKILPEALPMCYLEMYRYHKRKVKNFSSLKALVSVGGWNYNEMFKLFAAESLLRGAKLIEVQHGGGYGMWYNFPDEKLALEKDYLYSWGWDFPVNNKRIKTMPSPYMSSLKDTYSGIIDKMLFIGSRAERYEFRTSMISSDDISKYFNDKKVFFRKLSTALSCRIMYRLSPEVGWNEQKVIKSMCPGVEFVTRTKALVGWMKKAKIVVIDHPHTSFLEALTINVPSVFYWDHEVYLMRPEAEPYFQVLRDAGILYKNPVNAAENVNKIFDNPGEWWMSNKVQDAREEFCDRFAYARKDWLDVWVRELRKFT